MTIQVKTDGDLKGAWLREPGGPGQVAVYGSAREGIAIGFYKDPRKPNLGKISAFDGAVRFENGRATYHVVKDGQHTPKEIPEDVLWTCFMNFLNDVHTRLYPPAPPAAVVEEPLVPLEKPPELVGGFGGDPALVQAEAAKGDVPAPVPGAAIPSSDQDDSVAGEGTAEAESSGDDGGSSSGDDGTSSGSESTGGGSGE